ncbi:CoA pyrophosphatase [uncultured Flavobacterium sp.]|uniref:NUDIX hydrolase n=1 Tax=uncultured Flavobacterium sp. TaxID=165435 RepID=UPI0025E0B784|nr:CoA pyrophosphatase [uncultured Flavobacterium sp.]
MLFSEFTKYIPNILKQQLPAVNAHLKMSPLERVPSLEREFYAGKNPRISAVMMLFYPMSGVTCLALIKRNAYPGVHSSQISFPGGKAEPEDSTLADTALRETYEEIGILPGAMEVIMPFSEIYIPPSNFLVYPFMGVAAGEPVFTPNPDEVVEIIHLPLDVLLDDATIANVDMATSYAQNIKVPAFQFKGHIVWGATAMILSELKETIKTALK